MLTRRRRVTLRARWIVSVLVAVAASVVVASALAYPVPNVIVTPSVSRSVIPPGGSAVVALSVQSIIGANLGRTHVRFRIVSGPGLAKVAAAHQSSIATAHFSNGLRSIVVLTKNGVARVRLFAGRMAGQVKIRALALGHSATIVVKVRGR